MRVLEFAFSGDDSNSFLPHNHEANTVVYTGTHDNDTAQGWWANASPHERGFAGHYLQVEGADVHWALVQAAANSVANLALYQLQDVLGHQQAVSHHGNRCGTRRSPICLPAWVVGVEQCVPLAPG